MSIVGVSFDTTTANQAWATEHGFQYELWTDDDGVLPLDKTLALHYGSISSDTGASQDAGRVTRLLDANGDLLLEYGSVNVSVHPQNVLDDCTALFGP